MKKEYISPIVTTEELITQDVLISSTPDNSNQQLGQVGQTSLLKEMGNFGFVFGNNNND